MAEGKVLSGAGLRGQVAGETKLCTVGGTADDLRYCGYRIQDLAANASYEEVAWLLLRGELPTQSELDAYVADLAKKRELPEYVRSFLEYIPATAHPMDVMRSGVSYMGNLDLEAEDFSDQMRHIDTILARLPALVAYWHRFVTDGTRINTASDGGGQAEYFLQMMFDGQSPESHVRCLDASLTLYAEHEFNASTFTARVVASTLSDVHSCVAAAIGALRGRLHGGANEKAHELINTVGSPENATPYLTAALERKDKIMGFGHAIYGKSDPRNAIIKDFADTLATTDEQRNFFATSEAIADFMWDSKNLFPNADFFHASAYDSMNIPVPLYTPLFVAGRIAGWAGHIMEQRANNRIIRPSADYIGEGDRDFVPISQR